MVLDQLKAQPALIDQVHDQLVAAISSGRLGPGERLTQERVADMLGVSRQPVSHALQLLKHRGLVIEHGKRGLAVAPLDGARIRHLYQVREALDGLAARLAAKRVRDGDVETGEIEAVVQALTHGQQLSAAGPAFELVSADVAFHRALYDLSGNPEIAETVAEQWPQFMRSMA
ncbi:MAG: GntR family transcriptional regulator, partial [Hyphomicrobiaceae bacterium]